MSRPLSFYPVVQSATMTRPCLIRGLRIAWTAWCGGLCVLFVVLWVRSYSWNDVVARPAFGTRFFVQSLCGRIVLARVDNAISFTQPVTDSLRQVFTKESNSYGFRYMRSRWDNAVWITIPHWLPVGVFGVFATAPWVNRFICRFLPPHAPHCHDATGGRAGGVGSFAIVVGWGMDDQRTD